VSTDPTQMRAHSSAAAAERMRAHRKRRREGSFIVRVQLDPSDIDGFVRLKLLRPGQRQDTEALQVAVRGLIYHMLDGMPLG
jgi:hypothetical protein